MSGASLVMEERGIDVISEDKKSERKSKLCRAYSSINSTAERIRDKRIILQLTKPSHTLGLGLGLRGIGRHEARGRLRFLLDLLIRQRNWREASGVLSVLLKGSCRERLVANNRIKYWAAMEFPGIKNIKDIYDLWMKKIGSIKSRPLKDKSALLEFTLSCLGDKNLKEAPRNAICLMQDHVTENDPISNLIMGLCHEELLYDTLPNEMQLRDLVESNTSLKLEGSGMEQCLVANWGANNSVDESCSTSRPSSRTSVRNDKKIITVSNHSERMKKTCIKSQGEKTGHRFQGQGLYVNSADTSLDKHLLPDASDNMEDATNGLQLNQSHRDAVKYLQNALKSTPPALEALLPLVQLFLVGKQVKRAFDVVEKLCQNSDMVLPVRLMIRLLECHDPNNFAELSVYYEKLLHMDPTCRRSIRRLVHLCEMGYYNSEQLVEMIGLHMDATFPDSNVWRAFTSCMSKLCPWKGDRMSTCVNRTKVIAREGFVCEKVPPIFVDGVMEEKWKIRCKWWLNRHFSNRMFVSDVAAGDLELMAYKAACACQFYGDKFQYVVKVLSMLKQQKDPLAKILKELAGDSYGIFGEISVDSKRTLSSQQPSRFNGREPMFGKIKRAKNNRKEEMEAAMKRWKILPHKKIKKDESCNKEMEGCAQKKRKRKHKAATMI